MTDQPREPVTGCPEPGEKELCELLARLLARRWIKSKQGRHTSAPTGDRRAVPKSQDDRAPTSQPAA